ncbi:MAG: sugar phosphate isomerase/epimerase family protein, partial [Paracoccaceae bacterium]
SGLRMASGHFDLDMIRDHPGRVLEIADALGIEAVFVPWLAPDTRPADAGGWRAFGAALAKAGEPYWASGRTFGWHNHDFEFAATPSGEMPLDLILAADPRLALELDIAWVTRGGQDPVAWIEKYRDRIAAVHVKDIAPPGERADEDGWADVGHGVLDWPALLKAVQATTAKLLVMEHDNPSDDRRFATRSLAAIRAMKGAG